MSIKTAIDALETAIVTGTTGNTSDLISVLRTMEADRIPVFDTRADAEAADIGPHSMICVLAWSSSALLAPTFYERLDADGQHMATLRCADRLMSDLSTTDATNGGYFLPTIRHTANIVTPQLGALGQASDDTDAIQGCVDLILYNDYFGGSSPWYQGERLGMVTLYGESEITRPIQLNYGYDVRGGLIFRGTGVDRRAEGNSKGSALICNFDEVSGVTAGDEVNQAAIMINAARNIDVHGIWLEGEKSGYGSLDRDDVSYMDEATHDAVGGSDDDRRYNAHCGFLVDGRCGTAVAGDGGSAGGPYPDQSSTFPSWLPTTSWYGVAASSHCHIYDNGGRYFDVFGATAICDNDANGDFVRFTNNQYENCKYGIGTFQGQARLPNIRDNVGSRVFAHWTTAAYGPRAGKGIGTVEGNQFANCVYMYDLTTSSQLSTPNINANYGEGVKKIARVRPSSSNEITFTLRNHEFSFDHDETSGVPGNLIDVTDNDTAQAFFRLENCLLRGGPSVYHFGVQKFEAYRCRMDAEDRKSTPSNEYEVFAGSTLGNMIYDLSSGKIIRPQSLIFDKRDIDSLGTVLSDTEYSEEDDAQVITRSSCALTMWQKRARYPGVPSAPPVDLFHPDPQYFDRGTKFTAITRSGRDVTFTLASDPGDGPAMLEGLTPGGILMHRESGSVMFVKSKSTLTVVAELQTNYVSNGGGGFNTIEPLCESINASISAATQANPVVITTSAQTFTNGDIIEITGVAGMTELNNNFYRVNNVTATSAQLQDLDGNNIDGTGFTAYTSGGDANPGDIVGIPGGRFIPRLPIDITHDTGTSPEAVSRPDGGATGLDSADNGVQAGDLVVFPDVVADDFHVVSGTTAEQEVTAVSSTTITFQGGTPRANGTTRIGVCLRDPPSNV